MTEIKPCPFCGKIPKQFGNTNAYRCEQCGKNSGWMGKEDWNTRQLSESQKECERLKAEVERLIEYSAKMQIRRDDALRDLAEAYEAIREDWPIWIGQKPLAYSCSRCRAFGETKENFPHKPTCIVLTAQKARDGE